jgi:hypothetical protein
MMQGRSFLFLTNFSEACFQTIPTVAEWLDREDGHLTLLHVHAPGQRQEQNARKSMRSFFAEADRYARCERVLLAGDAASAAVDFCSRSKPDVVFAPASNKSGFPRLTHDSIRARLLRDAGVKLWTRGRNAGPAPATRPVENVAYVLTGHADWMQEAHAAARAALRLHARLHLIHLTPVQSVHDGTLAPDIRIGGPEAPIAALRKLAESLPAPPVVHSSTGDEYRELPRLLEESGAQVVFLGERHAVRRGLFTRNFNPDLERFDCEVVCFPDRPRADAPERAPETGRVVMLPGYSR